MPKSAKIILAIVIATLLGGSGYFYLKSAKKPVSLPVNKAPEMEIDTSDWQTYRSEELGFEIKMPVGWKKRYEYKGRFVPDDIEFWQEQVGGVEFIHSHEQGFPQFNVRVKDSELGLEEFAKDIIVNAGNNILVNGLQAKEYTLDRRNGKFKNYQQWILLNKGKRFYYFQFTSHVEDIDKNVLIWQKIISTFKSLY